MHSDASFLLNITVKNSLISKVGELSAKKTVILAKPAPASISSLPDPPSSLPRPPIKLRAGSMGGLGRLDPVAGT